MAEEKKKKKGKKKRSVIKELGRAYASIPKEAGKAAKRMSRNTMEMVKDLPSMAVNDPLVKNAAMIVKDPFNLGDRMQVPKGKMGGGRGKARTTRNMKKGGKVRGAGIARKGVRPAKMR